jgi:hypothetical protein
VLLATKPKPLPAAKRTQISALGIAVVKNKVVTGFRSLRTAAPLWLDQIKAQSKKMAASINAVYNHMADFNYGKFEHSFLFSILLLLFGDVGLWLWQHWALAIKISPGEAAELMFFRVGPLAALLVWGVFGRPFWLTLTACLSGIFVVQHGQWFIGYQQALPWNPWPRAYAFFGMVGALSLTYCAFKQRAYLRHKEWVQLHGERLTPKEWFQETAVYIKQLAQHDQGQKQRWHAEGLQSIKNGRNALKRFKNQSKSQARQFRSRSLMKMKLFKTKAQHLPGKVVNKSLMKIKLFKTKAMRLPSLAVKNFMRSVENSKRQAKASYVRHVTNTLQKIKTVLLPGPSK